MDRRATRSDVARTTVEAARRTAAESEYRSAVEPVARAGVALKKKSLYAAEQDPAESRQRRSEWREQASRIDPERLIFLDESSVATEMTRRYGRARRGRRVREGVPAGRWRTLSVLGAIRRSGWVGAMTIEAPTDGEIFLAYLEQVLGATAPTRRRRGDGQSGGAQGRRGARKHPGTRRRATLSATLLARLQPHRTVLGAGQATTACCQGPLASRTRDMPCRRPRRCDSAQHSSLLPPLRLRTMKFLKML